MMSDSLDKSAVILKELRAELLKRGWDACIVPSCDAHNSEYVALHENRLKAVTGDRYTGDAGTALIDQYHARIFVDSRFWLQAPAELNGTEWIVECEGKEGAKTKEQYITDYAKEKKERCPYAPFVVGIDATLHSSVEYQTLVALKSSDVSVEVSLQPTSNIVDCV